MKNKPRSQDYVIEIEAVNGPCYLNQDLEGDPGRTHNIAKAERFSTENEAKETLAAVRKKYPTRSYYAVPFEAPTPEMAVVEWNAKIAVGDEVEYRSYPDSEPEVFKTRTPAEVLSGHTAVVWLEGKAGCVCVDACRKVESPDLISGPNA